MYNHVDENTQSNLAVIKNNILNSRHAVAEKINEKKVLEAKCIEVFGTADVDVLSAKLNELLEASKTLAQYQQEMIPKYLDLSNRLVSGEIIQVDADADKAKSKRVFEVITSALSSCK